MFKKVALRFLLVTIYIVSSGLILYSQEETILYQNENTPLKKLIGDTLKIKEPNSFTPTMPGDYQYRYTKMQDSAYITALKLNIPIDSRFGNDLKKFLPQSEKNPDIISNKSVAQIIRENLDLPAKMFMPSAVEMTMYEYNLMQAQYIPFVRTQQVGGLTMPLSTIALFLGLIEDTSPNIHYTLSETSQVEVVIYSVQATVIATIYKGTQLPGSYKLVWNLRDEKGRTQPSGDYVAEVRIGSDRTIRKRIYIP